MGKPILYVFLRSPASRATILTVKTLGLDVEYVHINTVLGEQFKPEFLSINPQHTVPVLNDNGVIIWDSHAINTYLVSKFGKDDSLYPKDIAQRALVDQRLHFDGSILFPRFLDLVIPVFLKNATEISAEAIENAHKALGFLELFLKDNAYITGNNITLADFSCGTTTSSILAFLPQGDKYPKVLAWLKRLEQLPYFEEINGEVNGSSLKNIQEKLEENKALKN